MRQAQNAQMGDPASAGEGAMAHGRLGRPVSPDGR